MEVFVSTPGESDLKKSHTGYVNGALCIPADEPYE